MATLDDLRNLEAQERDALAQLGQTMQAKLDALQQKIDQGSVPPDVREDVQALQSDLDTIAQISQEQGRSAPTPTPAPGPQGRP